uniref:Nose resistant-to-fluoxetine protein N-terminal domain-containing protein n=1 Tax=Electrophorus electricus TaxID=8005 RepID=A0A4W4FYD3_ELEEL
MLSGSSAVTLSAILGLLLPGPAVRTLNVTAKCLQDTIAFLTELDKDTPEEYAALMFDAFGKPGSDVTGGNVNQVGSLTECLSVQGPGFKGQYCQLFLKQGAVEYFVGICVPDSCDEEEVKTLVFYGEPLTGFRFYSRFLVLHYLQAFSVQASSVAVLGTVGVTFSSLNGIRVLSLLWVVCGHTVQLSAYSNLDNSKRWKETVASSPLYVFAFSGPVYLAVDTFLSGDILSLRLVAYFLFKVQPLHLFMVCLIIALFSVLQRGVFWFIAEDEVVSCKKYWWSNLLLVNNLFTITNICAPWTWYLSIDFQFYVTTPLVIFLYRLTHENYFQYYYNKPYTRYGPYLLGMLAGLYMTTKTEGWQAAAGWLSSLSAMALLVGLAYALKDVPPHVSLARAVYQGLHRSVWALALVWIILACEEGYGGFVNTFLSMKVWTPLSNISFACYLVHPVLILLFNGKQETSMHYTDLNFLYLFLSHMVVTVVLGYVLTVLIEKPYLFLSNAKG